MRHFTSLSVILVFAIASNAFAADPIKHRLLVAEYGKGPNRLVELDADGKLVSEYKFPSIAVIFDVLPDGHVLYAFGGNPTFRPARKYKPNVSNPIAPVHSTNQSGTN